MSARLVEQYAEEKVVVYGTPPPLGRDLDVVASDAVVRRLAQALRDNRYASSNKTWVKFTGSAVQAVDLTAASAWGLSPDAQRQLFGAAIPLPGSQHLCRPAPAHLLLIEARRLVLSDGVLTPRSRDRVAVVSAEHLAAWDEADLVADQWGARSALACLRREMAGETVEPRIVRQAARAVLKHRGHRRPKVAQLRRRLGGCQRGHLVAVSGLDGSGKSGQAQRLAEALDQLGHETVVVWTRLGSGERLRLAAAPVKGLFSKLTPANSSAVVSSRYAAHVEAPDTVRASRERHRWLTFCWVLVVVLDHLVEQHRGVSGHLRSGRVVVCDRWTLDSLAHLRYRYAASTDLRVHAALLRRLAPAPDAAFLLEVPGAVAHQRKPDQYTCEQLEQQALLYGDSARQLGVTRVDGTAPVEHIAATLGDCAWRAVRARSIWRRRAAALLRR